MWVSWSLRNLIFLNTNSHSKRIQICDLFSVWSVWFNSALSSDLSAAAGNRSAAGWVADREEAAA